MRAFFQVVWKNLPVEHHDSLDSACGFWGGDIVNFRGLSGLEAAAGVCLGIGFVLQFRRRLAQALFGARIVSLLLIFF